MKNLTLFLSFFCFATLASLQGQVLSESFNSPNPPPGWTQEYVVHSENWQPVTENIFGVTPHSGSHMIQFQHSNYGAITKLVTPSMDLSTVIHPQLQFYMFNQRIGVVDELRVYYKTSSTGEWSQIGQNYIHGTTEWTEIILNLPEASSDYYLAFEGKFNFGGGIQLDDVTVAEGPACLAPDGLFVKNRTTTSAQLHWVEYGNTTNWSIEYGPAGFSQGSGTVLNNINTIGYTIDGLTPDTAYDFYVRSNCAPGSSSTWSDALTFRTTCSPISSFPWSEDFEEVTTPSAPHCWQIVDHNDDGRTFESDDGFGVDGSIAVGMYTDFNNGNNDDYLILPPFELNGNQQLTFYTLLLNAAQPDVFEVLLSTEESDIEDFTTVLLPPTFVNTAGPNEVNIDLSDYQGVVHIAVRIPPSDTDGYYIYFDNFLMEDINVSCPPVSAIGGTALGDGSIDLHWTANGPESEWMVEFGNTGFTQGTGTSVTVNDTPETNIAGLSPNTLYDFYVKAICTDEESLIAGPFTIRTVGDDSCGQTQYGNDFEGVYVIHQESGYTIADDFKVSASVTNFSLEQIKANIVSNGGVAVANITFYEDNNGRPGAIYGSEILGVTPSEQTQIGSFDQIPAYEVVFDLPTPIDFPNGSNNTSATYWVSITASSVDVGTPVGIEMTSINRHGNYAVLKYNNEPWTINPGGFDAVISVLGSCDTVDCPEPTNLTATNITIDSARITWNAGGNETEWIIEYGPAGFEIGTGTIIEDNDGIIGETISGLDPSTYYEYYVTAVCDSGNSFPAGPAGFSTLCGDVISSFPFYEGFEDNSGTRNCWTNEHVAGTPTDWQYVPTNGNGSVLPRTGRLMAQFKIESMVEKTKLVSPAFDLTSLDNPQLTFYYANSEWVGDVDELRVYYKTSANGSWTQIGNSVTTEVAVWTQMILDLPNPSAEYYIALEGKSNFSHGINVDDLMIAEAPNCMQPLNLYATHITEDAVELHWDAVESASEGYDWQIFANGADPMTATPVQAGSTAEGTTMVNVTGLDSLTVFDFYVTSKCSADENSALAGPTTFKTAVLGPTCGEQFFDSGGPNGDYGNNENITTIIRPEIPGDPVTVRFNFFDTDFGWDVLYVHNGPDATYPLFASPNPATPHFPAGGYYGQTNPGAFTSTHESGALTFVFRSDAGGTRAGWIATVECNILDVEDFNQASFSFYPNPAENKVQLSSQGTIETVILHNLLGQELMRLAPRQKDVELDVQALSSGTYLMTVTVDGKEQTHRILKK